MYSILLQTHSISRYFILILLIIVITKSLIGWLSQSNYQKIDKILLSVLTIFAHLQFVIGIVLYFISPWVVFNQYTMSNELFRYWSVEHIFIMLLAIIFISIPGISVKKLQHNQKKYRRTFIWTLSALLLILISLILSQRGIL